MGKIIPYNSKLKQLARKLRKDMTYGEVLLWNELRKINCGVLILTDNDVLIITLLIFTAKN
jgi:very-short-patch-repair endonuclease